MRFYLLLLAALLPYQVFSQEIEDFTLFEIIEEIFVDSIDSGFRKEIIITGSANDEDKWFRVYFGELDEVEIVSASWVNHKGKVKQIDRDRIYSSDVGSQSFFGGRKVFHIPIHKSSRFVVKYTLENPYLVFLSYLRMRSIYPAEKITKKITLAPGLQLHYDLPDLDHIHQLDEPKDGASAYDVYTFVSHPIEKRKSELPVYHHSTVPVPLIRIIVTKKGEPPEARLYKSISDLNKQVCKLSDNAIHIGDSLCAGMTDKREIAMTCYKFVQQNFNYINIENGLDALRPTDVNVTMEKRIGDCKDLSLLLVSMLSHHQIEAFYAIVPTTDFVFDMDFIAAISANHAVCALNVEDDYLVLDATDPFCEFGEPSMHTQGETMFIIAEDGPVLCQVPISEYSKNRILINLGLDATNSLSGKLLMELKGKCKDFYNSLLRRANSNQQDRFIRRFIDLFSGRLTYINTEITTNDSSIIITSDVDVNSSYFNEVNGKFYLNPTFVPRPWFFLSEVENDEIKLVLPFAFDAHVNCTIEINDGLSMPKTSLTELSENCFSGFFAIDSISNDV